MPVGFWNDPDGARYRAAYFERFPGVWHHGDWVELTPHGGMTLYGRSDAVLNPGGVRIGTAEIYRPGRAARRGRRGARDRPGLGATTCAWCCSCGCATGVDARRRARGDASAPRSARTPRRATCPRASSQVGDIPRTKSGKIVELAVRDVVHGRPVKNREALANPEALEQFANRAELAS